MQCLRSIRGSSPLPRLSRQVLPSARYASTSSSTASSSPSSPSSSSSSSSSSSPAQPPPPPSHPPLTASQRAFLASALRVNQAGELAATLIYTGQTPPIVRAHPQLSSLMNHMYSQEAGHLQTFNSLMAKHRIRPTALTPVWRLAASFLGWSTGMLGREAAMACTEAVETEIGNHYNGQVRELVKWIADARAQGQQLDPELVELVDTIKRIRDEELEHLDHAVENDAKEAKPYEALTQAIRMGCRGAIWVSERA